MVFVTVAAAVAVWGFPRRSAHAYIESTAALSVCVKRNAFAVLAPRKEYSDLLLSVLHYHTSMILLCTSVVAP